MASLKDIRTRIKSVNDTQQITRAMKMVASAKLRKSEQNAFRYRNFKAKIEDITLSLASRTNPQEHFLLEPNKSDTVGLVIITSDRGLCGAFNTMLLKEAVRYIKELKEQGLKTKLWIVGRKGETYLTRLNLDIYKTFTGIYRDLNIKIADEISDEMIKQYQNGEIGKMIVFYNYYKSMSTQITRKKVMFPISENMEQLFEIKPELKTKFQDTDVDYLYEPDETEILYSLLPMYISAEVYACILDSYAGELASRMTAMDNATKNCDEKIRELTILYNRLRQAAITTEISEIVGGANALEE